jgi:hypothetical protein
VHLDLPVEQSEFQDEPVGFNDILLVSVRPLKLLPEEMTRGMEIFPVSMAAIASAVYPSTLLPPGSFC